MPRIAFDNAGKLGFVADALPHELPPEAWSGGRNMRMLDGYAARVPGNVGILGTPLHDPNWLLAVPTLAGYYWLYASTTAVGVVDSSSVHTDITRISGPYNGDLDINWNGGLLQGIPVINNGIDDPQMWNPQTPSTKLTALANWPANTKARCIRPFKAFLFALDVTESGTRYPHKVRWSHPADPGSVPATWDVTDTTKDAGQTTLPDTGGFVLDCLPLRDANIVYKEDQTWSFSYVGGNQVFKPTRLFSEIGMLSRDCAAAFYARGLKHAVFGGDDLYVHDGNSAESIADRRVRRWLYNQLDHTNYRRSFVVANYSTREIWFCFVPAGQTHVTLCLPWCWEDNVFGPVRELPAIRYATSRLASAMVIDETWDSDSQAWDLDSSGWDERLYGVAMRTVIFGIPGDSKSLQISDVGTQFNGVDYTSYVERAGLAFARNDRDGRPKADASVRKLVKEIWPRIEAQNGTSIDIYVGVHDDPNGAITWQGPHTFIVGTHEKVTPLLAGRYIAVKFQTAGNVDWKLHSYEMVVEPLGTYR